MTKERMTKDEALKLALEALDSDNPDIQIRAAIIIRGVLAQHDSVQAKPEPEQEPVGEVCKSGIGDFPVISWRAGYVAKIGDKFYTNHQPFVGHGER